MEAEFAPSEKSVRDARHWTREQLREWGAHDSREVTELLVTELAANAVVHAASPFRVRIAFDGNVVRCEVADSSSEPPRSLRFAPEATAGRGCAIVEMLSARNGVEVHDQGKTVWFEIPAADEA